MKQPADNLGSSCIGNVVSRQQCWIEGYDCGSKGNGSYVPLSETGECEGGGCS